MKERRWVVLQVTPEFLVEMCKWTSVQQFYVNGNALPQDAHMVGAAEHRNSTHWSGERGMFMIIIESELFEPVPFGEMLPILNPPTFQRVEQVGAEATR